jgi:hypothetical protein
MLWKSKHRVAAPHFHVARSRPRRRVLSAERLEARLPLAAMLAITEIMPLNDGALADEDGEFSDWLELHNGGDTAADLAGFTLTDNAGRLDKWALPSVTLEPGGYLVVFASNKDRGDPAGELHTNFRLDGNGEYLALVAPDGSTIVDEYAPYPEQIENVSYGLPQDVTTLVAPGAAARVLVPANDANGTTWTEAGFDDSAWMAAVTGIGYEADPVGQGRVIAYGNLSGAGGTQDYGGSLGHDFVVHSPIVVTRLGVFDSGADGLALPLVSQIWSRNVSPPVKLAELSFHSASPGALVGSNRMKDLATPLTLMPGNYTSVGYGYGAAERNGNEGTGGPFASHKSLGTGGGAISFVGAARYGTAGQFPATVDGGPANRYSAGTFEFAAPAFSGLIGTDLEASMHEVNASAYLRIPFTVAELATLASLALRVKYDDGLVAYINGVEVARRNAPAVTAFDSTANDSRPVEEAKAFETINLTAHRSALVAGSNVLAIHGLNVAAGDDDFLVLPELVAATAPGDERRFFDMPTPGGANHGGFTGSVADTKFSIDRGFFDAPFVVEITTDTPDAEIRYTTDGSAPTASTGTLYTGPVSIVETTTLRAAAFRPGFLPSNVDTQTYLFTSDIVLQSGVPAGYPATWTGTPADYNMSQNAVDLPLIAGNAGYTVAEARTVIEQSLRSIPTVSIVMNKDDLFHPTTGIYTNPGARGSQWERPTSVEYILPDGSEGFQVNAGIRVAGFTSRDPNLTPKHSLRLFFRDPYGPARLDYPLFPGFDIERFNQISLRANARDSWLATNGEPLGRAAYIRDQWAKLSQRDMGRLTTAGSFVHLYLNGLYWGLYNPTESPDAGFAEEHLEGEDEEYDVIKFCCPTDVEDGSMVAWNQLMTLAAAGFASDAAYQFIQGNNPDGTRNEAYEVLLDVDNLIDFMIAGQYHASVDWPGNYYALRRQGPQSKGFQFVTWDNDLAIYGANVSADKTGTDGFTPSTPGQIDLALRQNAEYRLRFADRVHKHYFNGGALTAAPSAARWNALIEEVRSPLIAESARWGDYRRDVVPQGTPQLYTPHNQWLPWVTQIGTTYFAQRGNAVLTQLRSRGLYPNVAAPSFNQHGGLVPTGFSLAMSAPAGTIYYTTDGSDPRVPVTTSGSVLLAESGPVCVRVPTADDAADITSWRTGTSCGAGWISGNAGVGFDETAGTVNFEPHISLNVRDHMLNVNSSIWVRSTFEVSDPELLSGLTLQLKIDDGFVAFLNGFEVARTIAPMALAWNSASTSSTLDPAAVTFRNFDISAHLNRLVPGVNVLAIHGLNRTVADTDLLVSPKIVGAIASGTGLSPTALPYTGPITLADNERVKARVRSAGQWSALNEASFAIDRVHNLRVTEIMYHPAPGPAELPYMEEDYEYLEVANIGPTSIDLAGVRFIDGIQFSFGDDDAPELSPGEFGVLVRNRAAFEVLYGTGLRILGEYGGPAGSALDNSGETVTMVDFGGGVIQSFVYDDANVWPLEPDGVGNSLVIADRMAPLDAWNQPTAWRASFDVGGSPGEDDYLKGDFDEDRNVSLIDLAILQLNFARTSGATRHTGDLDGDAAVTRRDVAGFASRLGQFY